MSLAVDIVSWILLARNPTSAMNMFGTKTVLIIALVGFLAGRPDFLDISLLYALINFIGTIAVLKFLRYGDLGRASDEEGEV